MSMAHLIAVATIIMWSSLAALTVSLAHIPPLLSVGLVLMIAALPGLRYWRTWRLSAGQWACGVLGMFGYHFFLFDAFSRAPALNVNLIQYLWPLFIVLGTPLAIRLALNWGHIVGALLGFVGIAITLSADAIRIAPEHALGYAEALLAALLWAFYTLANKRNVGMPVSAVAGICLLSGLLSVATYLLVTPAPLALRLAPADIGAVLALGLGPMGLAFYSWDYAVRHGDPRFIGALSYLTPLLSTLLMVLLHRELALGLHHLLALLLIVCGASLGKLVKPRPRQHSLVESPRH